MATIPKLRCESEHLADGKNDAAAAFKAQVWPRPASAYVCSPKSKLPITLLLLIKIHPLLSMIQLSLFITSRNF
jgi:hypothetical protein